MDWEPRVGMRVVCVDDQWHGGGIQSRSGIRCPLEKGSIYTIKHVHLDRCIYAAPTRSSLAVILDEVAKPLHEDTGFNAARFKPLRERKTDISIFTALLTKAPTPEKEPA